MNETVKLTQQGDYLFSNSFGAEVPALNSDEPPPLGKGAGPSPVQLLEAAVGNCLAASLVFALRKYKQSAEPVSASVEATTGRNEQNRLRVQRLAVRITLGVPAAQVERLDRALAQFEEYCTVTQSVRTAIPVDVEVFDSEGRRLK